MRRTARTHIIFRDRHDPYLTFNLNLTAVYKRLKYFLIRIGHFHFQISHHCPIGFPFNLANLLFGNLSVEIHRAVFTSQMESHILIPKPFMNQPGNDMLSGMLLHLHKTKIPVNPSLYTVSNRKRRICPVKNHTILFLHIQHSRTAKYPCIRILSSPFRKKGSPIQHDLPVFSIRDTLLYLRRKSLQMTVQIKQFFRHILHPLRRFKSKQIDTTLQNLFCQFQKRDITFLLLCVFL